MDWPCRAKLLLQGLDDDAIDADLAAARARLDAR